MSDLTDWLDEDDELPMSSDPGDKPMSTEDIMFMHIDLNARQVALDQAIRYAISGVPERPDVMHLSRQFHAFLSNTEPTETVQ